MKYYGTKLLLLHNYMSPNFSDEATDRKKYRNTYKIIWDAQRIKFYYIM